MLESPRKSIISSPTVAYCFLAFSVGCTGLFIFADRRSSVLFSSNSLTSLTPTHLNNNTFDTLDDQVRVQNDNSVKELDNQVRSQNDTSVLGSPSNFTANVLDEKDGHSKNDSSSLNTNDQVRDQNDASVLGPSSNLTANVLYEKDGHSKNDSSSLNTHDQVRAQNDMSVKGLDDDQVRLQNDTSVLGSLSNSTVNVVDAKDGQSKNESSNVSVNDQARVSNGSDSSVLGKDGNDLNSYSLENSPILTRPVVPDDRGEMVNTTNVDASNQARVSNGSNSSVIGEDENGSNTSVLDGNGSNNSVLGKDVNGSHSFGLENLTNLTRSGKFYDLGKFVNTTNVDTTDQAKVSNSSVSGDGHVGGDDGKLNPLNLTRSGESDDKGKLVYATTMDTSDQVLNGLVSGQGDLGKNNGPSSLESVDKGNMVHASLSGDAVADKKKEDSSTVDTRKQDKVSNGSLNLAPLAEPVDKDKMVNANMTSESMPDRRKEDLESNPMNQTQSAESVDKGKMVNSSAGGEAMPERRKEDLRPNMSNNGSSNSMNVGKGKMVNASVSGETMGDRREKDMWEKLNSCDFYDGNWVKDDSYPLYKPGSCPYIDEAFDCFHNGRPERAYEKYRWQPKGCNVPRLNATDFLELLRGKRMVFVGDSLNRNMWESMVCVLRNAVRDKRRVFEASGRSEFRSTGYYNFVFNDYNCTVEFFRSIFLVRQWEKANANGTKKETLRVDIVDHSYEIFKNADIIVFNTAHWWTHEKTSQGKWYYQEGGHVYPELNVEEAFRKAMTTWGRWLDANIDQAKTMVFFRGYSSSHFGGGVWNAGGRCDKEIVPYETETYVQGYLPIMSVFEKVMRGMKTPVRYMNVTKMTDFRKDAHPSLYRTQQWSEEEKRSNKRFQDCSHWCLPGVPETWNEILYAQVLAKYKLKQLEREK